MAHFAELDENNVVIRVIAISNDLEDNAVEYLNGIGLTGNWIQTSYNGKIRKNFAGAGMTYDSIRDAFIYPQCHEIAILDEETCIWNCSDSSHIRIFDEADSL
jgi:hypothetical protein